MGKSKKRTKKIKKRVKRTKRAKLQQNKEQTVKQEDGNNSDESEVQEQLTACVDEFSTFIKSNKDVLRYIISTQNDLLYALLSNGVLDEKQFNIINEKGTPSGQVRQLLEEITTKSISDEMKQAFHDALDQTQQRHVSNWIRGKGERSAEYADHWPLYHCTEFNKLKVNRRKLIELVDSKNGLLNEMFSSDCINDHQKNSIESGGTREKQNDALILIVLWGSLATYKLFIDCLLTTNQHLVVSLLEPSRVGNTRPLSNEHQTRLKKNYSTLVRLVDSKADLTAELLSAECINELQKEFIESSTRQSEMNARLIDIVRRGSEANFFKFIECMNKTGRRHVSRILTDDGSVAHFITTISPENTRERQERHIVDQLTTLLRNTPDERRMVLFEEARQRLDPLHQNQVTLLTARMGQSVALFFFAESQRGMQYLYEIYSSMQLQSMMQDLFNVLLSTDDSVLDLRVDTLRWDFSNYTDCVHQLCVANNLPILAHVYDLAKLSQQLVSACNDLRSLPIDQFPFELIEMLLIRATCYLFVAINKRTPRAEVYTVATITAVCFLWWEALRHREYTKRWLKSYFKRTCHPFKCTSKRLKTGLHVEGGNNVVGLALFNNELLVACKRSDVIRVFDSRQPFRRLEDIQVRGLHSARDITACNKSSSLFIADCNTQYLVWRVNLFSVKHVDEFLALQWQPSSLSVNSGRLLVTPYDGDSLYLYGDDGRELHHIHIQLPPHTIVLHAVETTRKTCIVSHRNSTTTEDTPRLDGVVEVDLTGQVVRKFYDDIDTEQFNWLHYLVSHNNHVLIADFFNERVITLNTDQRSKRILVDSTNGEKPYRMCITPQRLLFIGCWESANIDIFRV